MKQKGFSIIELIVVMGIISIISVVAFPIYRDYNERVFLEGEARKLTRSIERMRSMSVEAREIALPEEDYDHTRGRRYGIRIGEESYELFIVTNIVSGGQEEEVEAVLQRVDLRRNIMLFEPGEEVEVMFSPPDPSVHFSGAGTASAEKVELEMGYEHNDERISITVNRLGLVEAEKISEP